MLNGFELELRLIYFDEKGQPYPFLSEGGIRILPELLTSSHTRTLAKLRLDELLAHANLKRLNENIPIAPLGDKATALQLRQIADQIDAGLIHRDRVRLATLNDRRILQIDLKQLTQP